MDLHYDHGLISSGITFNSFLVHRNGECIVIRCSNLLQRMSKLQLYVEVVHGGISCMIHTSLSFKAAVDFSMCAIIEFSIVATLNVWLNGNLLCLLLENKSAKMSLLFADKFEKMEGNARMMLDDFWGRWKTIVMVANVYCTEELRVNFLEDRMKLDEKCLGYVMSTIYTPYPMQKLGFKFNYQNLYQFLFSLSKLEGDLSFQLTANISPTMDITPDDLLILEAGISCFQKLCDVALDYYHVESLLALSGEIERALLLCRRVLFPCFISELVKGDHQLQLFLPYDTLFVMGEAFTNSELLQHKYQFDLVDVMAVVASAIIQLQLNEATESYKRVDKLLRAFGICISFNHLANHHSSNGPQVLIEQLVDIECSVDIYEATMVHWLANYDEGPNWQGAMGTGTWFIKMHGFHHISTIKVLQQHTCLQHMQLVMRKLIQAETQVPQLVKKTILANEICEIQGNMDGSINADSPPIFSCFGDLALTMILYSLWLIRAWHKSMGYLPFEDSDYPTMPWFIYIFLGLGVTLCSGHGAADTAHGYGFQMTSCRGAQILIQNMKLEDKFV
ncbi:hypothetical protein RchiOBHm_Chr7g0191401 [Rosa chinensis]|uniref:Uncharacterized protein n=1 Tax=Rosa chinensis TaxID=74649 RepID=A0A2P6P594_ROSCH|nr:hypothetical protein RchiOBHm_Chr7g0191401 [Rosa chinensis]